MMLYDEVRAWRGCCDGCVSCAMAFTERRMRVVSDSGQRSQQGSLWMTRLCRINRDQLIKMALTAIGTLLVLQYTVSIASTTKYWRHPAGDNHTQHNTGLFYWLTYQAAPTKSVPLPRCPNTPPSIEGLNVSDANLAVFFDKPSWEVLQEDHTELLEGGEYVPPNCTAINRIALIIPYRDRDSHLRIFLNHIHPFLQRQQLRYTIFVIEQNPGEQFNRAMLMNIGYTEARKVASFDCFVFHDVDLLPENDFNLYRCPEHPRHMTAAVDTLMYRLPYPTIFGGVSAMTSEQFSTVNGFSNFFFGWGGEDDDMYNRLHSHGYKIQRYPARVARYRMIRHPAENPSGDRYHNLYTGWQRFETDGLNSLAYNITALEKGRLYTRIQVTINQTEVLLNHEKLMRNHKVKIPNYLLSSLLPEIQSTTAEPYDLDWLERSNEEKNGIHDDNEFDSTNGLLNNKISNYNQDSGHHHNDKHYVHNNALDYSIDIDPQMADVKKLPGYSNPSVDVQGRKDTVKHIHSRLMSNRQKTVGSDKVRTKQLNTLNGGHVSLRKRKHRRTRNRMDRYLSRNAIEELDVRDITNPH